MPKKIDINAYYNAFNLMTKPQLNLNTCDYLKDEDQERQDEIVCPDKNEINQEIICIKKNLWENLSEEAKEIIKAIIISPSEIITKHEKKITIARIKKHFTNMWKSEYITEQAIKEIKSWVKKI